MSSEPCPVAAGLDCDTLHILRRLRSAEGHLRGIEAMVEQGADCASVIHQILAVQAALSAIKRGLVRNRLADCLGPALPLDGMDSGADADDCWVAEITRLYQLCRQDSP